MGSMGDNRPGARWAGLGRHGSGRPRPRGASLRWCRCRLSCGVGGRPRVAQELANPGSVGPASSGMGASRPELQGGSLNLHGGWASRGPGFRLHVA